MSSVQIDPITKSGFEQWLDETGETVLTEDEWKSVAEEIEGRVENYLDGLLTDLVQDYKEKVGVFDKS